MNTSRRQKRVASLIKEEVSRLLIEEVQDSFSGLITVTKVDMTADLRTAHIYLSLFGIEQKDEILAFLDKKKGFLRKAVASKVKLKYNPMLIFSMDPSPEYHMKVEKLLEEIKKNEK